MAVSLDKPVSVVRVARVFSSSPGVKSVRVTEYSNAGVRLTYFRPDGTCFTDTSLVNDWRRVLDREIRAEHANGVPPVWEILFGGRV